MLRRFSIALALVIALPCLVWSATYIFMEDWELAERAEVIVHGEVVSSAAVLENDAIVTIVTIRPIEVLKGALSGGMMNLRLPGGRVGQRVDYYPGTPSLEPSDLVIVFASTPPNFSGQYALNELGLSHFAVVEDEVGTRFAIRPAFYRGQEQIFADANVDETVRDGARELSSFLTELRSAGRGDRMSRILLAEPRGSLRPVRASGEGRIKANWVNIGYSTANQFRWFWDTGGSPNGVVTIVGNQTNLTDASNGHGHVQNSITKWTAISGTDVRYSGPTAGGNVTINLDVNAHPNGISWGEPMGCAGGILGLGGVSASGLTSFKGVNHFHIQAGPVHMRTSSCVSPGYSAAVFRSGLLHEMGHTLGLGHPDQGQNPSSTTNSSDWDVAVMRSSVPPARPDTPLTDDIQAMQYYYPGAAPLLRQIDVDGTTDVNPFADGILIIRRMLGASGTNLTAGALPGNATRVGVVLEAYLDTKLVGGGAFDVDGNGAINPFADGILLIRYMLGATGNDLIANAVDTGATRTTAAAIQAYLDSI